MKNRSFLIWLVHFSFIVYMILDYLYLREKLFPLTLPVIKYLQANFSTPAFIKFNQIVAYLLKPDLCALFNVFYLSLTSNKYKAAKTLTFQIFSLYLLLFYKILANDPRPYFVDKDIKCYECYADFGNPSGHATSVWMFYGILFTDIYHDVKFTKNKSLIKGVKYLLLSLFLFLKVSIIFCRIFLGVHSFNQVLLGSMFGIYIYLVYLLQCKSIMGHVFNFLRNSQISKLNKFLKLSAAFFLAVQVPVLVYQQVESEVPQQWADNVLIQCPQMKEYNKFYQVCFRACATISIGFATLFIFALLDRPKKLFLEDFRIQEENENHQQVFTFVNFLKAILLCVLFIAIFFAFTQVYHVGKFVQLQIIYDKYYSMVLGGFLAISSVVLTFPLLYKANLEAAKVKKE